jgi:hypothetical protein
MLFIATVSNVSTFTFSVELLIYNHEKTCNILRRIQFHFSSITKSQAVAAVDLPQFLWYADQISISI